MKTLLKNCRLIITLLLTVLLVACSNDDDDDGTTTPEPTVAELLTDQWFFIQQEDTSTDPSTIIVFDNCQDNGYADFNIDGTLNLQIFFPTASGGCESEGLQELTYSLTTDGQSMVVTDGTITQLWLINNLTESELIIEVPAANTLFYFNK